MRRRTSRRSTERLAAEKRAATVSVGVGRPVEKPAAAEFPKELRGMMAVFAQNGQIRR